MVVAQLVHSRTFPITELPATSAPGILALIDALMSHTDAATPNLVLLRMLRVAGLLYGSIEAYHRLTVSGLEIDRDEFVSDLIDSLVAVIAGVRTPSG